MVDIVDNQDRYGLVSRALHWGMAALFAAQFLSAIAHGVLSRGNAIREVLWSYHPDLGATLFLLVLVRGIWGVINISKRPAQFGPLAYAVVAGHLALYACMVVVPAVRLLAAIGGTRGFSYLGIPITPGREAALTWTQVAVEWHGEMGWILAALVIGHVAMAVIWHRIIKRDTVLKRMA